MPQQQGGEVLVSAHDKIKQILDEWDPISVLPFSPDEYLPLADEISDSISSSFKLKTVYCILKRTFRIYGIDFTKSNDECWLIAEKILKAIQD